MATTPLRVSRSGSAVPVRAAGLGVVVVVVKTSQGRRNAPRLTRTSRPLSLNSLDPHCAERKQPGGSYHFVHISVLKLNIGHEAVPTVKVKEFYWRNLLASNKSSSFFSANKPYFGNSRRFLRINMTASDSSQRQSFRPRPW